RGVEPGPVEDRERLRIAAGDGRGEAADFPVLERRVHPPPRGGLQERCGPRGSRQGFFPSLFIVAICSPSDAISAWSWSTTARRSWISLSRFFARSPDWS